MPTHPITAPARARIPARRRFAALPLRPVLHVESLLAAGAAFVLLTGNGPFWRAALAGRSLAEPGTWLFAAALFLAFGAAYVAAAGLFATRRTVRPLLAATFFLTAAASFYMDRYAIYFDRAMLRNVLATDVKEARDLLSWGFAAHMVLFGLVPSILLWWPVVARRGVRRAFLVRVAWTGGALAVAIGSLLPVFADFASLVRNQKEVRHLLTPGNIVAAAAGNAWGGARRPAGPREPVGADAKAGTNWQGRARPVLFVLVVGETGRADNFSLNGYGRDTNPELAKHAVVNFPEVTSCGTSTEVSLPCMFSPFGRAHYDEAKIRSHESVLDVLARAGFQVLWRDNQSGCKGVCDGVAQQRLDSAKVDTLCAEGQCLDEILLHGMEGIARDARGNLFVVMHQLGSHGPAYFKRYPALFRRFAPACENAELRHCSETEIRNAYDNSLLYTDHFLGRVIDFLGSPAAAKFDTAMLYVSDHGESLGESGLYLHGIPYAIAPRVQTHVPMVAWFSPGFRASFALDERCLRENARRPASHDNLFHSLLGLLDVSTAAYERRQDLFAPCRPVTG